MNAVLTVSENRLVSRVGAGESASAALEHDYVVRRWIGPLKLEDSALEAHVGIRGSTRLRTMRALTSLARPHLSRTREEESSASDRAAGLLVTRNGTAADMERTMKASIHAQADAQARGEKAGASEPRGASAGTGTGTGKDLVHPLWLRITHWLNALAAIVMVLSGWRIYDASPVFKGFMIPLYLTLGGWLAGALQWHFAAMWFLVVNGLIYLGLNLATGRLFTRFFPLTPHAVFTDLFAALTGRLHHDDLRRYNAVQKLAYLVVIVDLIVLVLSGLAIWKSVQFPSLRWLMGGYDTARIVHFCAMAILVAFFVVHVVMVAIVPRSLLAMLRGR